jgi:hypothetical protein
VFKNMGSLDLVTQYIPKTLLEDVESPHIVIHESMECLKEVLLFLKNDSTSIGR